MTQSAKTLRNRVLPGLNPSTTLSAKRAALPAACLAALVSMSSPSLAQGILTEVLIDVLGAHI